MSTYCAPTTGINTADTAAVYTDKNPCLPGVYLLMEETEKWANACKL